MGPSASGTGGLVLNIVALTSSAGSLDSGYVFVAGPTTKSKKAVPGTTVTIDSLLVGTYTVSLEGFSGNAVTYFGQTGGVSVVAGSPVTATVTFVPFGLTASPQAPVRTPAGVALTYPRVSGAASYVVQTDNDALFATAHDTSVTDTSVVLPVVTPRRYYLRVIAVDPFGKRSSASPAQSMLVRAVLLVSAATGAELGPGTLAKPFKRIQEAIDTANARGQGGDVLVAGGSYTESVTLRAKVSVCRGHTAGATAWTRPAAGGAASAINGGPVAVTIIAADSAGIDGSACRALTAQRPVGTLLAYRYSTAPG